jgi:hypothetical protein
LDGFAPRFRRLQPADQDALREGLHWIGRVASSNSDSYWACYPRLRRFLLRAGPPG